MNHPADAPPPKHRAPRPHLGERLCQCIAECERVHSDDEIAEAERALRAFAHRAETQLELPL